MATGIYVITVGTVAANPFAADALTGTNLANGTIVNQTVGRYVANPQAFAGITINVTSGGQARLSVCFGPEQVGRRVKAYITFANTVTAFEVQIWGPDCWVVQNPGSGPATPNSISFGNPVGVFDDFGPDENNPPRPPPTHNPFVPWLLINVEQMVGACALTDIIRVTINAIPSVAIASATVYRNGMPTGLNLAQLTIGVTFTDPGEYEARIVYQYLGDGTPQNPPGPTGEALTRFFTISKSPFPHIQRQAQVYGYLAPGDPVLFDNMVTDDGTIEYNPLNGAFTLRFCGYYFIKWFIAAQGGTTTDGTDLAVTVDGTPALTGSSHAKNSTVTGYSIIKADGAPPAVQLVSVSDGIIEMSRVTQVKAGIVIFKIGEADPI